MSYSQTPSSHSPIKSLQLGLQPAPAWIAILGLVFFTILCVLAGVGSILNFAFPAGALGVGIFLYFRYPIFYIGFTWWMWFLSPLVRRLADYRGAGFTQPSPIILAPYLVVLVTLVTLWQHLPRSHRQGSLPFVLALGSLFYSFVIGLVLHSPTTAGIAFLDWLVPVLLGFHLFVNWRDYPRYCKNIRRVFLWGVLVMGVYGIVQYLVLPGWDQFWIVSSEMASAGTAEPLKLNVHSTMNSRGPFALYMMAGLLLLFSSKGALRFPASTAGYLAFLLTTVRTAWVGWVLGLLTLSGSVKSKLQMRLIVTVVVIAVLAIPLTTLEPFSERINQRVETFSNLEEDRSFQARQSIYGDGLNSALTNFLGEGMGGGAGDSGLLSTLLTLGLLGTIFYCGGMLLMIFSLFQGSETRLDQFASTARAIVVSVFAMLPMGNTIVGVSGVIFWGFLGIGMAARRYHQTQSPVELNQPSPESHGRYL